MDASTKPTMMDLAMKYVAMSDEELILSCFQDMDEGRAAAFRQPQTQEERHKRCLDNYRERLRAVALRGVVARRRKAAERKEAQAKEAEAGGTE